MDNSEFQAQTQRVEKMVQRVDALPDNQARATALELLQSVMDLHGAAMSRIVELLSEGEAHHASLAKLAADPLMCGLFVLYGIHPWTLEERITGAFEKLRPQLQKEGGDVQLLGISDATVRAKIQTRAHALAGSPEKMRNAVEQAVLEAAPEVVRVIVEGVAPAGFVPLDQIQTATKEKAYEESTA